jgi:YYY domain-containing protein
VGIPVLSVILYLPYYMMLTSPGIGGIFLVTSPSAPLEFLLVHGLFLGVLYVVLRRDIFTRPYLAVLALPFLLTGYVSAAIAAVPLIFLLGKREQRLSYLLAALGLAIIVLCEIVYLKDNMGEVYFRMNTVFKCYLPAWILLGSGVSLMVGEWWTARGRELHLPGRAIAVIAVGILLVTPLFLHLDFGFGGMTLDGLGYVETRHPEDAAALPFLRTLPASEILVEAEGGDYTYYSRISSFTGVPSVIGMPFHEYMWRGDTARVMERVADVREIYENSARTVPLMQKYNATVLYVGPAENEQYRVSLPVQGLQVIYDQHGVQVYRLQ